MSDNKPVSCQYESEGKVYKGTYKTHDGMITVRVDGFEKERTTQLGGHSDTPETLARMLMAEIVREG